MESSKITPGSNLAKVLLHLGIHKADLSRICGVSDTTPYRWILRDVPFSGDTLTKLKPFLDKYSVNPDFLNNLSDRMIVDKDKIPKDAVGMLEMIYDQNLALSENITGLLQVLQENQKDQKAILNLLSAVVEKVIK